MFYRLVEIIKGGSKPSMDEMLEDSDRHLQNLDKLILPAPESKPRTPFNSDVPVEEVSMANLTAKQKLTVLPKALPLFANMQLGARMYDGTFQPTKSKVTPEFIFDLERMARALGAKDVGYVKVPRNAIFQGKGLPHDNAIIFTVEMDKEQIATSPSFESQAEVMDGYKRMAIISRKLAKYLRKHGYAAYPGMALGGITDYVYLAELAGLGAIGYHGLLISPGEGARLRINTIYTNITNLPTPQVTGAANEHLWVRDFCAMCKKCMRLCPVEAIFDEPQPRGDGGMQTIEHATCREYFTRHYGCAVCLAVCPFSQVGYGKVRAKFKGNPSAPHFRIQLPAVDLAQNGVLNHAGM